jgi:hypothetical protein
MDIPANEAARNFMKLQAPVRNLVTLKSPEQAHPASSFSCLA